MVADAPIVTDGTKVGFTVSVLLAKIVPQEPPDVVNVRVTLAGADEEAVYVVVLGVVPELFVKVPPAPPSDHTALVAPPPNDPPNAAVVLPWHSAAMAPPTFTVGLGFTVMAMLLLVAVVGAAQVAFETINTVNTSPFVIVEVV